MTRIYLDQKDYINIAKGLLGDTRYSKDVESYKYLTSLVKQKKISIYYSWAHISETLKHKDVITEMLKTRCEVLDELTQGNCLLQTSTIIRKEIKSYLLHQTKQNISESEILEEYPYGKHTDCIEFDLDFGKLNKSVPVSYKDEIKDKVNKKSLKELRQIVPNTQNFTKKDYIRFLTFDPMTVKKYFNSTFRFKNLILKYRSILKFDNSNMPQLERANEIFEIMQDHQKWLLKGVKILENAKTQEEKNELEIKLKKRVKKQLKLYDAIISNVYRKNIIPYIQKFLDSNNIDSQEALEKLDNFDCILGVIFYKDLLQEYIKSNTGLTRKLRKVDANDYFDIEHLRYLPYVDFYVTERYFSNLAKSVSGKYDTIVFKNINELKSHLETLF